MADPAGVLLSGFVGVCIDITVHGILDQINIAVRCKKELNSLGDLAKRIEPIISQIQQYRLALNREKGIPNKASAVNQWLEKMDVLLKQGLAMAQECTIPSCDLISRYQTSRRITHLISDINQHLDPATLMAWASVLEQFGQSIESVKEELVEIKESVRALASNSQASTSAASTGFFIKEPLIVGQENDLARLEESVVDEVAKSPFLRIGVVGKGGSGKSLLLRTLFNSKKVRGFFCDGLLLWLTVTQSPSFTSLCNELSAQIAAQTKADLEKNMNQEAAQIWLHERMQENRFVLMLDDVWEDGAQLLEELGLLRLNNPSNSTVIVTSRNRRTLLEMGIAENSIIPIGDLAEDDSWRLFACHGFPYNDGKIPANIHEETARLVCARCGGLPLAIKAVGRAMSGITDRHEWESAVRRLPAANRQDKGAVYDRLRLSYDALGSYDVNLQMCFLYLVAFLEDEMVSVESKAIPLWMGEGLLAGKKLEDQCSQNPFELGRIYVNVLADRCLIEPIERDFNGRVFEFRMHDVLRDLAIQIAEHEENFYCRAGQGLTTLNESECSGRTRILLNNNNLTSLPQSWSAPQIRSLTVRQNNIIEIPRRLFGGMTSLKILDLNRTSLESLPESVGCLKQLVYLNLAYVPIKKLPPSFTNLVNLQILNLRRSRITKLPSDIHKLRSLKYLSLHKCADLQCLPYSISGLTSLQHLQMSYCNRMWTKQEGRNHICKRVASLKDLDLGNLAQLKSLNLSDNGQAFSEGTFEKFAHMETLLLNLATMTDLPHDMTSMSKLRRLTLHCPRLDKLLSNFCEFRNLSYLRMWYCQKLEELPHLHKLQSLTQLHIVGCSNLKKFSIEFGENGIFPLLEIFSLVELSKLEELPILEEGAMPSLQILTSMNCEKLEMSMNYLNLKTLKKIRVFGCPRVLENLEEIKKTNTKVEVITTSTVDLVEFNKRLEDSNVKSWLYDEFWCNEVFLFLSQLYDF